MLAQFVLALVLACSVGTTGFSSGTRRLDSTALRTRALTMSTSNLLGANSPFDNAILQLANNALLGAGLLALVGITSLFYQDIKMTKRMDEDKKETMKRIDEMMKRMDEDKKETMKRMDEDKKETNDDRTETKVIAFVAAVVAVAAILR
jgi:mannitol-specific phosphotransferase system IIBC component